MSSNKPFRPALIGFLVTALALASALPLAQAQQPGGGRFGAGQGAGPRQGVPAGGIPGDGVSISDAARVWLDRSIAARDGQDPEQELAVLEEGLKALGPTSTDAFWLWLQMRQYHADRGNNAEVQRVIEQQLRTVAGPGQELQVIAAQVTSRASVLDRAGAKQSLDRLAQILGRLRLSPAWSRNGDLFQAWSAWATGNYHAPQGHAVEAEAAYQACVSAMSRFMGPNPDTAVRQAFVLADCSRGLVDALVAQGKLAEAGAVAAQQRAFVDRLAQDQQRPQVIARLAPTFARVALEQGRTAEARRILDAALAMQIAARAGDGSGRVASLRLMLAQLDMLEGNWEKALELHEARRRALEAAPGGRGNRGVVSDDYAYTLVRLGRAQQAVDMMKRVVDARETLFDANSLYRWEGRAFYGVALAAAGQRAAALAELGEAVPRLLELSHAERSSTEAGVLRATRLNWILDGYIRALSDAARDGAGPAGPGKVDPVAEAFRLADLARGSTVQRALAASASRANISDPALAALARREQDLQREMSSLSDAIGNLLSRGRVAEQDKVVADMRADLTRMRNEHAGVRRDLQRRFPDYAGLLEPRPASVADLQRLLKPGEAMVSIYTGSDRTLVWAIPQSGPVRFTVSALSEAQIADRVGRIRKALDADESPIERLPAFDFAAAHELYSQLLAPVEAAWQGARELVIVPHGRLGQLPFGVLTTAPFSAPAAKLRYGEFAQAPWLIRRVAVSQLPAAVALVALRGRAQGTRAERAFAGFGDPVFSTAAAAGATRSAARRNLVVSATPEQRADPAAVTDLALLAQLPDTAEEIMEVAKIMGADAARDIYLQRRASERNVKATDLSGYRVVMFATHGLVPGDMPGLFQPALALSNPAVSGDGEDGLLTMDEILGLRLRADWVVLSACNTASPTGSGGEAVSGLGRAFFYAGAKALLVTNWPVETVSARLLTTDTFRRQSADATLSRARALQQASLGLMQQSAGEAFSYAHPLFWAPYVVVGDGG